MLHPLGEDRSANMQAPIVGAANCPSTKSSDWRIGFEQFKSKNLEIALNC